MLKNKALIAPLGLVSITILSGAFLMSSYTSATDNTDIVDNVSIEVPISCSLEGTGMTSHNANIVNGTYQADIGSTTLKAFCNDDEGFAIYAIGYTDNEDGKNVLTDSSLGSTYDIATGTATSGNTSNWAMKLSTITSPTPTYPIIIAGTTADTLKEQGDPDYSTFQEVPDDYTKVAYRTAGTDTGANAEGATLTTTYQAYISKTQPAGAYTGQVKYTLVHPHDTTAPVVPISLDTATTLQEVNTCSDTLTIGQVYTLTDSRDNEKYKVAKLADGNCWMLDNLRLDPTNSITASNLSEENTNAPTAAIANLLNGGNTSENVGWTNEAIVNKTSGWNTTNPNNAYEYPYVNNESKNVVVTSYGNNDGKVGLYYNFCAASAGTYCYSTSTGPDIPDTEIDSPYDLCPLNWRIPTGGISGDFQNLATAIIGRVADWYYFEKEETSSFLNNASMALSGGYYGDSSSGQNTGGRFWSSTRYNELKNYDLFIDSSMVDVRDFMNRGHGYSIRCILNS